jgi:DNA-binding GntR family transcriptional regulator
MTATASEGVAPAGTATGVPGVQPSLSARAYTAIRDMLITAEITPGSPVNEDQLAKKLQMGRTPVREAIKRLETERLVVIYPRRGIFATQVALSDLTLLTEVRVHLEGEAAFQAARRASRAERMHFDQLLAEAKDRGHETTEEIDFDSRVHRAIYRATHNPYLESTLEQYFNLTIRIWHVWTDRLPEMSAHVSELIPLLERVVDRDADGARDIATQHVASFVRAVAQTP